MKNSKTFGKRFPEELEPDILQVVTTAQNINPNSVADHLNVQVAGNKY
jgi:hypothetical protein